MIIPDMYSIEKNGRKIYKWRIFDSWSEDVSIGITCRIGGISTAPFSTLNLGHGVADNHHSVIKNRQTANILLGTNKNTPWAYCNQVHGTRIIQVPPSFTPQDAPFEKADGIILTKGEIVAAILLADCLPIALYDPLKKIGALCHAGWRGTLAGIAAAAVESLVKLGSKRTDLVASAGPGIGPCCFNVGEEVAKQFHRDNTLSSVVSRDEAGSLRINLEEANLKILKKSGLRENRLGRGGFCTACRPAEFYSYRKERGITGRHAALMILK